MPDPRLTIYRIASTPIRLIATAVLMLTVPLIPVVSSAQTVSKTFTYQGELQSDDDPADGSFDMTFELFDAESGGSAIGNPVAIGSVPVEDGLFSVALDFGADIATGDRQWLEISIGPAGSGSIETLSPRTELTASPYAISALNTLENSVNASSIVDGSIGQVDINTGQIQRRVNGSCPDGEYIDTVNQDGSVNCSRDATGTDWQLGGNAGTDPATDFIGTTDAQAFEIRAQSVRSLRIEPSNELVDGTPITVNIIGGSSINEIADGSTGSVISGGGGIPGGSFNAANPNSIFGDFNAIAGGEGNQIGRVGFLDSTSNSIIAGGTSNTIDLGFENIVGGGRGNFIQGERGVIAGGEDNTAIGSALTIGGGSGNEASDTWSTVAGGAFNSALSFGSTVGGGTGNMAAGGLSTVSGGNSNAAMQNFSTIAGGRGNSAVGFFSTASGGVDNCAGADYALVGGRRAKVRPGDFNESLIQGCAGVPTVDGNGDEGTFVWADAQDQDFVSTGPNQFLIRSAGGVAINTTTPRATLTVTSQDRWNPTIGDGWGDFTVGTEDYGLGVGVSTSGGGRGTVRMWPRGNAEHIFFTSDSVYPASTLEIRGSGRVGVGRNPSTNAFEVQGNASKSTAGAWLSNSDARIKTEIAEIPNATERLLQLKPVTFRYSEDYLERHTAIEDVEYYNVIAQEYAEVFPQAVQFSGEYVPGQPETDEHAVLQVDFHPAMVTTVAAVQELAIRLEQAEADNFQLKAQQARQATELAELRILIQTLREDR